MRVRQKRAALVQRHAGPGRKASTCFFSDLWLFHEALLDGSVSLQGELQYSHATEKKTRLWATVRALASLAGWRHTELAPYNIIIFTNVDRAVQEQCSTKTVNIINKYNRKHVKLLSPRKYCDFHLVCLEEELQLNIWNINWWTQRSIHALKIQTTL